MAEGVRIYSQDTWRMVTEGAGKHLVEKYIDDVVRLIAQCMSRKARKLCNVQKAASTLLIEVKEIIDK